MTILGKDRKGLRLSFRNKNLTGQSHEITFIWDEKSGKYKTLKIVLFGYVIFFLKIQIQIIFGNFGEI